MARSERRHHWTHRRGACRYGRPRALTEPKRMKSEEFVMPGLVSGIHVFVEPRKKNVDGRDKPGHDEN
jgi:hypothetical protein